MSSTTTAIPVILVVTAIIGPDVTAIMAMGTGVMVDIAGADPVAVGDFELVRTN